MKRLVKSVFGFKLMTSENKTVTKIMCENFVVVAD